MLGKGSRHAEQCLAERFVGADYGIERDLSRELPDSCLHAIGWMNANGYARWSTCICLIFYNW